MSSNVVGESKDENNFLHKLLSTNTQVLRLHKAFANGSSVNIKLSKIQLHKVGQSGGFLVRPLLKTDLPLIRTILKLLAKTVLNSIRINSSSIRNRCIKCLDMAKRH